LVISLISEFIINISILLFGKFPSLTNIFIEFLFELDDFDIAKINDLEEIKNKLIFNTERNEWKITVRYVIYNKQTKKCSEYCDKNFGSNSNNKSSSRFCLLLCRYSKTSCLRKVHKYVFQLIMKFMTNYSRYQVNNSKYNLFYPKSKVKEK